MIQKDTYYSCSFHIKSKKHLKNRLKPSNIEVHKPETSCKYSETKKVKQVHSVIQF